MEAESADNTLHQQDSNKNGVIDGASSVQGAASKVCPSLAVIGQQQSAETTVDVCQQDEPGMTNSEIARCSVSYNVLAVNVNTCPVPTESLSVIQNKCNLENAEKANSIRADFNVVSDTTTIDCSKHSSETNHNGSLEDIVEEKSLLEDETGATLAGDDVVLTSSALQDLTTKLAGRKEHIANTEVNAHTRVLRNSVEMEHLSDSVQQPDTCVFASNLSHTVLQLKENEKDEIADIKSNDSEIIALSEEDFEMSSIVITNVCSLSEENHAPDELGIFATEVNNCSPNNNCSNPTCLDFEQSFSNIAEINEPTLYSNQLYPKNKESSENNRKEINDEKTSPGNETLVLMPETFLSHNTPFSSRNNDAESSRPSNTGLDLNNKTPTIGQEKSTEESSEALTIKFECEDDEYESGPANLNRMERLPACGGQSEKNLHGEETTGLRIASVCSLSHVANQAATRKIPSGAFFSVPAEVSRGQMHSISATPGNHSTLSSVPHLTYKEQGKTASSVLSSFLSEQTTSFRIRGSTVDPSTKTAPFRLTGTTSSIFPNLSASLRYKSPSNQHLNAPEVSKGMSVTANTSEQQLNEHLMTCLRSVTDKPGSQQMLTIPMPDGSTQNVKVVFSPTLVSQASLPSLALSTAQSTSTAGTKPVQTSGQFFPISWNFMPTSIPGLEAPSAMSKVQALSSQLVSGVMTSASVHPITSFLYGQQSVPEARMMLSKTKNKTQQKSSAVVGTVSGHTSALKPVVFHNSNIQQALSRAKTSVQPTSFLSTSTVVIPQQDMCIEQQRSSAVVGTVPGQTTTVKPVVFQNTGTQQALAKAKTSVQPTLSLFTAAVNPQQEMRIKQKRSSAVVGTVPGQTTAVKPVVFQNTSTQQALAKAKTSVQPTLSLFTAAVNPQQDMRIEQKRSSAVVGTVPGQTTTVKPVYQNTGTQQALEKAKTSIQPTSSLSTSAAVSPQQDLHLDLTRSETKLSAKDMVALIHGENLVPPLPQRAPPASAIGQKTSCYRCMECFTVCSTIVGYKFHFKRMSMVIRFACMFCRTALVFFNKCTFLAHLRKHAAYPTDVQQMLNGKNYIMSVSSLSDDLLPPTGLHLVEPLVREQITCSECHALFSNTDALAKHFGSSIKSCSFVNKCCHCNMPLPTACSLKAHLRLHDKDCSTFCAHPDFVCPECGLRFVNQLSLYQHIFATCLHFTRCAQLICEVCKRFFPTEEELFDHLVKLHPNPKRIMCQHCERTFISANSFGEHVAHVRRNEDKTQIQNSYILKPACGVCKSYLTGQEHAKMHMKKALEVSDYVFVCPFWHEKNIFMTSIKSQLIEHIVTRHNAYRFTCTLCMEGFVTLSLLRSHIPTAHGQGMQACRHCPASAISAEAALPHVMWHVTKYLNCESSQTTVISKASMEIIVPPSAETNGKWSVCRMCGSVFNSHFELSMHIHRQNHRIGHRKVCPFCQRFDFCNESSFKAHKKDCRLMFNFNLPLTAKEIVTDAQSSPGTKNGGCSSLAQETQPFVNIVSTTVDVTSMGNNGTRGVSAPGLTSLPASTQVVTAVSAAPWTASVNKPGKVIHLILPTSKGDTSQNPVPSKKTTASQMNLTAQSKSSTSAPSALSSGNVGDTCSAQTLRLAPKVTLVQNGTRPATQKSSSNNANNKTVLTSQAPPAKSKSGRKERKIVFEGSKILKLIMPGVQKASAQVVLSKAPLVSKSSAAGSSCARKLSISDSDCSSVSVATADESLGKSSPGSVLSAQSLPTTLLRKGALLHRRKAAVPPNDDSGKDKDGDSDVTIVEDDTEENREMQKDANAIADCPKLNYHLCHLCGLKYSSIVSLSAHLDDSHMGGKTILTCKLCFKQGKHVQLTRSGLQKHLTKRHHVSKFLAERMTKTAIYADVEAAILGGNTDSSSISESSQSSTKSLAPAPNAVLHLRVVTENNNFVCAKCDFATTSKEQFTDHIRNKHLDKNTAQCLECGLCFSSISSLKKHLFLVHKVKELEAYIKEHDITISVLSQEVVDQINNLAPLGQEVVIKTGAYHTSGRRRSYSSVGSNDSESQPAQKRTKRKDSVVAEFECKVCYRGLESEGALKKHMRIHGMAFIRSRRVDSRQLSAT